MEDWIDSARHAALLDPPHHPGVINEMAEVERKARLAQAAADKNYALADILLDERGITWQQWHDVRRLTILTHEMEAM